MKRVFDVRKTLLAAALLAAPLPAALAGSSLDLYYVGITELEVDNTAGGDFSFDDGDGYGAKGRFKLTDELFLAGEYQNVEYDELSFDSGTPSVSSDDVGLERELETWRAGLGYQFAETPFYLKGEYIGLESELSTTGDEGDEDEVGGDIDEDGFGAHLGATGQPMEKLSLTAQIGYLDIGDVDGLEYLIGAALHFTDRFGIFADYRYTSLSGDGDDYELNLSDARVGLRLMF